jgi:hypothetical protein
MSNGDPGLCASEGVALASVSTFFYYIIGCAAHNAGLSFPSLFSLSSDCGGGGAALDNRENNIHLFHLFFLFVIIILIYMLLPPLLVLCCWSNTRVAVPYLFSNQIPAPRARVIKY